MPCSVWPFPSAPWHDAHFAFQVRTIFGSAAPSARAVPHAKTTTTSEAAILTLRLLQQKCMSISFSVERRNSIQEIHREETCKVCADHKRIPSTAIAKPPRVARVV